VTSTTYVALLRGINVGGKKKVPMKELRSLFEGLGHSDVRTYVQSGNVIFSSPSSARARVVNEIERAVSRTFGIDTSVLIRAQRELARIAEANPFPDEKPTYVHVAFLADRPSAKAVSSLDPDHSPPDEFVVKGREIYLRFPKGSGRSKLTIDYFERKLGTRATARNWNTVLKVLSLMEADSKP
jgi:uncharacterized protein (DUF1697 family)